MMTTLKYCIHRLMCTLSRSQHKGQISIAYDAEPFIMYIDLYNHNNFESGLKNFMKQKLLIGQDFI